MEAQRRWRRVRAFLGRTVLGELRRAVLQQGYYRLCLRRPIDPDLALFAAYWYRGCLCNPRAIYEAARELVPGLRAKWIVERDWEHAMPAGIDYVIENTPAYYDAIARARVLVNNVNFPSYVVKRPGTVHVMTHHGTPLKRMGMDLKGFPVPEGELDFDGVLRRCARWDFSLSSNRHSTEVWKSAYPGRYETLEYGYPRNDVLVRADAAQIARVRDELGIAPGQRALLYAPTFRDNEEGYVDHLDVAGLAGELGPDWVVLSRRHHRYDAGGASAGHERVRDVSAHPSVEALCLAADALVTDYSSVMFDYAILDRPIVVHAPDWEEYRATRGAYFDLLAEPPGVVVRRGDELADALLSGRAWGDEANALRAAFRERFCSLEDGHAAERVVKRVWPAAGRG